MDTSKTRSTFQTITSRELNGFRVRKRPCFADDSSQFSRIGAFDYGVEDDVTPPMALSFCKTSKNAHILAVTGEDGYVCLYNTRFKFSDSATRAENAEKARKCQWLAHDNAIFDVCWIKDDTNLLTACGDHSIKVWDSQERKCLLALTGHTGSVKSISAHPSNNDIIVSGSRDGSFALWDLRCAKSTRAHSNTLPIATVQGAHKSSSVKTRGRHNKAASMSVTSVLYMKDEVSIATAGAVDSVIKFWDTRSLKAPITQACSQDTSSRKWVRSYGISSLSQDLNGVYISASCMDSRIYLFNVLQLEKGHVKSFEGSNIGTFFVKSKLSPDAGHIVGGSSDGFAYVWQVNKPQADPVKLEGHDGEVTAVDWCSHEVGKIATAADDSVVQLWNINSSCYSNTRSPSSIRRRERTLPVMKRRKLFTQEDEKDSIIGPDPDSPVELTVQTDSPNLRSIPEIRTPASLKKQLFSPHIKDACEGSPDASFGSPSSVLNPPPSIKRKTILDYFLAPSS
ncbi:putative transcription factor WD40-like family [Helianthus annuus]|nr:putative transcription factor WD40-like family [Helianthus annuus]KAJ0447271.1 putative transcription factor WD40-like family [Helianthus annuus]KAJ0636050.1 putative transcription factor WD40-like family [Helianthus annuus]KAJ0826018.1 putative transcription factor WD40-like family [Helianthus annuus]